MALRLGRFASSASDPLECGFHHWHDLQYQIERLGEIGERRAAKREGATLSTFHASKEVEGGG